MYLNWEIVEDAEFRAATDGHTVFFSPEYLMKASASELRYVAIHEIHHVIMKHFLLRKDRDPLLWNIACDHKINLQLNAYIKSDSSVSGKLSIPDDIYADEKYEGNKWLEEDVYDDLLDKPPQFTQVSTGLCDFTKQGNSTEEEAAENRRVDKMVEAAAKVARDAGKLPGFLQDFIMRNREHQVDWKAKLRRFLAPLYPTNVSWERLNKRAISRGIYMPGVIKEGVATLAILVDTSGSVSDEQIAAFINELNYIIGEMKPTNVQVNWFESYVWKSEYYQAGETLRIPDKINRGGTNFAAAFAAVDNDPKAIICLTDMYDSFEFKQPDATTIWVATSDEVAPWGETIKIKF